LIEAACSFVGLGQQDGWKKVATFDQGPVDAMPAVYHQAPVGPHEMPDGDDQ
jgi:hypothetical protein